MGPCWSASWIFPRLAQPSSIYYPVDWKSGLPDVNWEYLYSLEICPRQESRK
jgi:hypothetical protein